MALHSQLKQLVDERVIGFEDVFKLYAEMCIQHVRDFTQANIQDEGIESFIKNGGPISVESLTQYTVSWALQNIPEMLADNCTVKRKEDEPLVNFVIRNSVEHMVRANKAFKITIS